MIKIQKHYRGGWKGDFDYLVCEHKHRSLKAARKCARGAAYGVLSDGSEKTVVIHVDGEAVEQFFAVSTCRATTRTVNWRTKVECVLPGSPLWQTIPPKRSREDIQRIVMEGAG